MTSDSHIAACLAAIELELPFVLDAAQRLHDRGDSWGHRLDLHAEILLSVVELLREEVNAARRERIQAAIGEAGKRARRDDPTLQSIKRLKR